MTVSEYVKNKETKMYAAATIKNGKIVSFVNGKAYTAKELEAAFPTNKKITLHNILYKGDNPDKTRIT